jgi:aspartyl protease family protein
MKYLLILLLCGSSLAAAVTVQVTGLFRGAAVLQINGQQQMLREGKTSPEGVLLVSATPKQAVLEINGQRQTLSLSQHITSQYSAAADRKAVVIPRNNANQYITYAALNGRRQQVLVDTGANVVAMNSQHARQMGIDYQQGGVASRVTTASGVAPSYQVKLRSVSVGGIQASGVNAVVIEGNFPQMILLGMSYLQHVDMSEQNGSLVLEAKY